MNKEKIIVFATGNDHKLREVNMMIHTTGYVAKAMKEFGIVDDIEENGISMHENAKIKADFLADRLSISAFGEDSGLEIDALDGRPGIFTARYAGPQRNDQDNMDKVLAELEGIANRSAQFRSVIALHIENEVYYFEGIVKGSIANEKRGKGGFGYDPIFIPEGYTATFAELGDEIKNSFSHRAKAVEGLVGFLKQQNS